MTGDGAREFLDRVILDVAPAHTGPPPAFIDDEFVLRHEIGLDALRAIQTRWEAETEEMTQHLYGSVLPRVPARSDQSRYAEWLNTGRYPIPACVQDEIARLEGQRWTTP